MRSEYEPRTIILARLQPQPMHNNEGSEQMQPSLRGVQGENDGGLLYDVRRAARFTGRRRAVHRAGHGA